MPYQVEHWPNGRKKTEAEEVNGKIHGIVRTWYENGQLESESEARNGKLEGGATGWHPNGTVAVRGQRVAGLETGLWTHWYPSGSVSEQATFLSGELDGPAASWHENGQKKREGEFRAGKPVGKHSTWYPNGSKKTEQEFIDGMQEWSSLGFYESGQRREFREFRAGRLVGLPKVWNIDGTQLLHATFACCCACSANSWSPGPTPEYFVCDKCRFCIDVTESLTDIARRAAAWAVAPTATAGLPLSIREETEQSTSKPRAIEGRASIDGRAERYRRVVQFIDKDWNHAQRAAAALPNANELRWASEYLGQLGHTSSSSDLTVATAIMLRIRRSGANPALRPFIGQPSNTRPSGCLGLLLLLLVATGVGAVVW
jgi:antitoxin component YwqK of YwqJK toxin-antitoxin module